MAFAITLSKFQKYQRKGSISYCIGRFMQNLFFASKKCLNSHKIRKYKGARLPPVFCIRCLEPVQQNGVHAHRLCRHVVFPHAVAYVQGVLWSNVSSLLQGNLIDPGIGLFYAFNARKYTKIPLRSLLHHKPMTT